MFFPRELITWYQLHKRDLPWRHTRDPYTIWLSEIILQQTRVEQGLPYFNRFIDRFPTIADFAAATEDEILRYWQGLGYYSRARNMHQTAQMVMERFGGTFPSSYGELISLKGIGSYTAAAIASFSAHEPYAVVDGNVYRVLSRYFGIDEPINTGKGRQLFAELATKMLYRDDPSTYNQAIMEFGALQCRPQNPACGDCPLGISCAARQAGHTARLPVKLKTSRVRDRFFDYFILSDNNRIWMNKRGPGDIWENLYEFPLIETAAQLPLSELLEMPDVKKLFGDTAEVLSVSRTYKHLLSHQKLHARFITLSGYTLSSHKKTGWNSFFTKELDTLAKPKLIYAFLQDRKLI